MGSYEEKGLDISEKLILRFITTVLTVAILNMANEGNTWKNIKFVSGVGTSELILSIVIVFVSISICEYAFSRIGYHRLDSGMFIFASICMGYCMLKGGTDIYLTVITVFMVIVGLNYQMRRFPVTFRNINLDNKKMIAVMVLSVLIMLLSVGVLLVLRFFLFATPTYDFGIFAQMYHYMKETFTPMTTCERGYLLSHFAVHFSPIYYLILPIYAIFPSPVTLIVVQHLIVISGIIPVYMICKERKMSKYMSTALMMIYLFYPSMSAGLFYDFHENKFLPPLLLWLFYFLDTEKYSSRKKKIGIYIFTILCLFVKEDAAIYVACIGLFNVAYKKKKNEKITGALVFMLAVVYFLIVYACLGEFGEGKKITSIGRYDNLMVSSEDGLFGMLINIVKDPAFAISQFFEEKKLQFILWTMGPIMFVPLMHKNISALILVIPYAVINLLTDYVYQFDIGYQYTYGSCTLLIYLVILWFEGRETLKKKRLATFMVLATMFFTINWISGKNYYRENTKLELRDNLKVMEVFDTIPKDASVKADTWFVVHLCDREEVYDYDYSKIETDYVVLDMRTEAKKQKKSDDIEKMYESGYEIYKEIEDKVLILYKK